MRGELEAEQNCNILTPTLMATTAFLSRSPGQLNRGPWDPASLGHVPHSRILSPTAKSEARGPPLLGASFLYRIFSPTDLNSNYLTSGLHPGSTSTFFLWASQSHSFNPSTVKIISWYSSTGWTCYLHWCISYFDSLAGVNMLHQKETLKNSFRVGGHIWHLGLKDFKFSRLFCCVSVILELSQQWPMKIIGYV